MHQNLSWIGLSKNNEHDHKSNLKGPITTVQTTHALMPSERRSLTQNNTTLIFELELFKYQLNVLKVSEHYLKQQNETLQEEANSTNCLLNEQVEDLNERFQEFHETNVRRILVSTGVEHAHCHRIIACTPTS